MEWNWQKGDWPNFRWNNNELIDLEKKFLLKSGILVGSTKHLDKKDKELLVIDVITSEAIKTSEIEGELLNRDSVQSSILRNFGLNTDNRRIEPAEQGIANMMTSLYKNFDQPLSHSILYDWHTMITNGRSDLKDIGCYRTHKTPMQVVSGRLDSPKVHFEAPPSSTMKKEMNVFIKYWKDTFLTGKTPLPALTRAGLLHLYFVCIHPFEDGNGRIGRALAEKSLAEFQGEPTLIALSQTIELKRSAYYDALEQNNKSCEVTNWLVYFANTILDAQDYSLSLIEFLIEKTKLYDKLRDQLNERQEKVLDRIFREGLSGFKGGLSAENYISITGVSRATVTRDLQDLVEKGALIRTGKLKNMRYHLNIKSNKAKA